MDAVEDIKARLSIEDVVSEYVQLKRAGRNLKGLSPFGNEKTPSFMVSPEKQIWHDFSSGKGGNMFSFVMEMEGLDFKGALELLARKAGVDLSQYRSGRSGETTKLKERLYLANEMAAKFYQVQFSKSNDALEYIFNLRKFTKPVVLDFKIGYSPNTGDALVKYLKKQGITEDEAQKAGLATKRYSQARDMFRGRIMVPLMDAQGRVIGFTARLLDDQPDAPKYINTPQTLIYDKGRHVFGLHLAKDAIRQNSYAVVSEGNLDVLASHQAGVKQVVATAGTAMTESHLKALSRFTDDIRIAFDQDVAGQNAAERVIPIASKLGVTLSIVAIGDGKDPDELIRKSPDLWQKTIDQKQYALDWLIEKYRLSMDLKSAEGKRRFSDVILTTVKRLEDPVEQDHYVQKIAGILDVGADSLRAKIASTQQRATPALKQRKPAEEPSDKDIAEHRKVQDHLLSLCFHKRYLRQNLEKIQEDMLLGEEAQQMLNTIKQHPDRDFSEPKPAKPGDVVPDDLLPIADYVKIMRLQFETLYDGLEDRELGYEAKRLRSRLIDYYVKTKKAVITQALDNADDAKTKQLLEEARALDLLRKNE